MFSVPELKCLLESAREQRQAACSAEGPQVLLPSSGTPGLEIRGLKRSLIRLAWKSRCRSGRPEGQKALVWESGGVTYRDRKLTPNSVDAVGKLLAPEVGSSRWKLQASPAQMVISGLSLHPSVPAFLTFDSPHGAIKTAANPGFALKSTLFQKMSLGQVES